MLFEAIGTGKISRLRMPKLVRPSARELERLIRCLMTLVCLTIGGHLATADEVVERGTRLLGIGVNEGSIGFDKAFPVAQKSGIQFVELPQQWDEIEPKPGKYTSQWLDIANAYYPQVGVRLVISLNPIDTTSWRVPEDLRGKPIDHPKVIARYKKAVDYVLSRLPDTKLVAFSIGNEIDGVLGANAARWSQYERFFKATADYVRRKIPDVPVGAKAMLPSAIGDLRQEVQAVNQHADALFLTYYPLNSDFSVKPPRVVHDDISTVVKISAGKPIYLLEAGYPSSPHLGSSQQRQAEFIQEIFKVWDQHHAQVRAVNFIWLHDISTAEVNTYQKYYGVNARSFGEYLGTLGLRTHNGKDKRAFQILRREATARGW